MSRVIILLFVFNVLIFIGQITCDIDVTMATQPATNNGRIPLDILLGQPDRFAPLLSPDGNMVAYLAPYEGILNIWVMPATGGEARLLTHEKKHDMEYYYYWTYNGRLMYRRDTNGDENFQFYLLDINTGDAKILTPSKSEAGHSVMARGQGLLLNRNSAPGKPCEVLFAMNIRDPKVHDIYRVNLNSGKTTLVEESKPNVQTWLADNNLDIRGYVAGTPDGGAEVYIRNDLLQPYQLLFAIPPDDIRTTKVLGFTGDNRNLILIDSIGRNAGALCKYDIESGAERVILEDSQYDIVDVLQHPQTMELVATCFSKERIEWHTLSSDFEKTLVELLNAESGDLYIVNQSLDGSSILVGYTCDNGPILYGIYNRKTSTYKRLFAHSDALSGLPLAEMKPINYPARDGLEIHGYLTIPNDATLPVPLVLKVHGGPWERDYWGFNPEAQWLANLGYACLQVNYRGSIGYGKSFLNAGNREWGGMMQNDLTDAVEWAIEQGITEKGKVVIFGESYGGYAAFAGAAYTPDMYAGAVAISGISNLQSFLSMTPAHFTHRIKQYENRIGRVPRYDEGELIGDIKPESEWNDSDRADVAFLASRSPVNFATNVKIPMLIAHGANDPRVPVSEAEQMVEALEAAGVGVEYVAYPDEGHGLRNPSNRIDFYIRAEKFLAKVFADS